ncbi:MAG TPA: hypothetical protein VIE43_19260 [Thermoanaerobaculia bacterium]|jgi:hypothetical protein|nr:hypothetical protein [Thermoanaerobaculia bacterium]
MRNRSLPLLFLLLLAVPAFADDVYLVNGRKFEGVIAETSGTQVRIRMQGGSISLPKDQVLRVEAGDSNLAEYLRRKEALKKSPAAGAADWLELARWARAKELDQATREAALTAATFDPRIPGVAPILRGYGYVLDPQIDRWVSYSDSMRRRGFVLANGQWLTRDELQEKQRAQEEAAARYAAARQEAARAAREDRLAALAEISAARQLAQPDPSLYQPFYGNPFYGGVVVSPGFFGGDPGFRPPRRRESSSGFTHIPGSLIGGSLFPGN